VAESRNYLFGYGERLREPLEAPRRQIEKFHPYTVVEARKRLAPRIQRVAADIEELPDSACPRDEAVAAVTLHPSYLAKSFFPSDLLRELHLDSVGSRPRRIRPEKGTKKQTASKGKNDTSPTSTTIDIFVRGRRSAFEEWAEVIPDWPVEPGITEEIIRIEDVRLIPPVERVKPMRTRSETPLLEVVLHRADAYVLEGFREYLQALGLRLNLDERIVVQNLCFLPLRAPVELHQEMAKFSFLRVAREMPAMRELRPAGWASVLRSAPAFKVDISHTTPINPDIRVGIFDGGVPDGILPATLVRRKKAKGIGKAVADAQSHGLGVTSSLLYGTLVEGEKAAQPYAAVDHYRVIDENTVHDPQGEYFEVINRVMDVLNQNHFDFVNLSLGPDLPIEDDEIHVWTACLDAHFSSGKTLVTIAAGNSGANDWDSGNARIQAPADGVNILAVGATDRKGKNWKRAGYSSIGPGRRPGFIKPDIVAFGGSSTNPFWVLDRDRAGYAVPIQGTSFASPNALRAGLGVRAYLGPVVQPVGLKALLIHHSDDGNHEVREVGWGRVPLEVEELITCADDTAHVLYQGTLDASSYLRLRVPLPAGALKGKITIAATFCYATEIDPQDPLNYTRAGLDITFRPNSERFSDTPFGTSKQPSSKTFFSCKAFASEEELRHDAHKWETSLKATRTFFAASLKDPAFDVHYNARLGGAQSSQGKAISYALVVTVHAKHVTDLYNRIAQRYRTQLEPLRPIIRLPIRTS
jgi:hypothetical protein